MDYPQLNLLFGLALNFTLVMSIGLRILLSKAHPPVWMSVISWTVLVLCILASLYIETLFLRFMTPSFNRQIAFGFLLIGGIGVLVTVVLCRRELSPRATVFLFGAQMLASLICIGLAIGLYRSLVAI